MPATTALTGLTKAAILLVLLGEETASAIYRNLPQQELHEVSQAIASIGLIHPDTARQVLEEYHGMALTQEYLAQGGREYASRLLVKAFGEDGAKNLLESVSRAQELSAGKLDSLQKADPQQLAKFLESEHPQTIALIMARSHKKDGAVAPILPGNGAEGLDGAPQAHAIAWRTKQARLCRHPGSV
jgi:flagellar motor switch protein FliG